MPSKNRVASRLSILTKVCCFFCYSLCLQFHRKYCFNVLTRFLTYFKGHKEIESLVKQEDHLVKRREKLRIKRECYLQTLSLLCGKAVLQTMELFFIISKLLLKIRNIFCINILILHTCKSYFNATFRSCYHPDCRMT